MQIRHSSGQIIIGTCGFEEIVTVGVSRSSINSWKHGSRKVSPISWLTEANVLAVS